MRLVLWCDTLDPVQRVQRGGGDLETRKSSKHESHDIRQGREGVLDPSISLVIYTVDCGWTVGHVDILVQYPILIPRYPPQDTHTASSRGRPWVSSTRTQQTCKVLTMAPWAGFASAKRISVVMALLYTSIQTRRFFPFNGASEENRL